MSDHGIIDLYERRASTFARERGRDLHEKAWLDRFLALVPAGGSVLDVGCGTGEPIARYVLESDREVSGIDSAPSMIAICRERFPGSTWHVADMRALDLGRRFDGIVAWDSFFHLDADAQRRMFPIFAAHSNPGGALIFTSGPHAGEAIGDYHGEPLYHASLDEAEYRALLDSHGFTVSAHVKEDPSCGMHTIWLATFNTGS